MLAQPVLGLCRKWPERQIETNRQQQKNELDNTLRHHSNQDLNCRLRLGIPSSLKFELDISALKQKPRLHFKNTFAFCIEPCNYLQPQPLCSSASALCQFFFKIYCAARMPEWKLFLDWVSFLVTRACGFSPNIRCQRCVSWVFLAPR